MSSYAKRLAGLKKSWDSDKAVSSQGQLPEGKYQFEIKRAVLGESKASFNKGNAQVEFHCAVITGPLKGRKHIIRQDLESKANIEEGWPSGISRFKGYLETLKVDMPKTLDENGLNKCLKQLVGIVFEGACVHNQKGYANVYINELVNASDEDEDEEEVDEDEDEDEAEESEDKDSEDEEDDEEEDSDDDDESEDEDEDDDEEEEEKPAKKPAPKPASKSDKKPAKAEKPAKKEDDDDWSDDEFDEEK